MRFFYTLSVALYHFGIIVSSLFSRKAKQWLAGRKDLFRDLEKKIPVLKTRDSSLIWVHCASLGEFEQGRPVIEKLKAQDPGVKILLTFFSPSGYQVRKNYAVADHVCYLPVDYRANVDRFLDTVQPVKIIFVKYEFWFNFLSGIFKRRIPCYLISAEFRLDQYFFRFYGSWFRNQLKNFTHIFLQSEDSRELLDLYDFKNISVSGDTRFDRVFEIPKTFKPVLLAEKFCANSKVIICGSTWEGDERVIADLKTTQNGLKFIIAPHEVDESHMKNIEQRFRHKKVIRFSFAEESTVSSYDVLLIDNIGMLSSLYHYASVTYVGGGFNKTVHNILEPAAHGKPVIFGPNFHKFREAYELMERGGAFTVNSAAELDARLKFLFSDPLVLKMASLVSENYVREKKGATEVILSKIWT